MRKLVCRSLLVVALLPVHAFAQEAGTDAVAEAEVATAESESPRTESASEDSASRASDAVAEATAADETDVAATAAAPASDTSAVDSTGLVGVPAEGMGQIVFFRPSKLVGGAVGFKVREGETELGKLRSGRYFIAPVAPGVHEYTVHSEAKDVLTLEVEAGETYYVQGTISMGVLAGRPNLSPADATQFAAIAAKLKPAK